MEKLNFSKSKKTSSTIYSEAMEIASKVGIKIGAQIKSVRIKTIFGRDDVFTTEKGLKYNNSFIFVDDVMAIMYDSQVGYCTHSYFPMIIVIKNNGEKLEARHGGTSFPIAIEYE
ncbi:hypothetical protein KKA39_00985 [Patescibacteria group bacterium]|nr:hypothetical protein [Patescibacteria group bacterium]